MFFFYMNKIWNFDAWINECMMQIPLFVNFFFSQKWMMYVWLDMNLCMKHTLCIFHLLHCIKLISIDPQFVVIFRFMESLCFDFFPLNNIPWSD